ncbi:MAG: hypothetical protein NT040_01190 [Bacteroidetes bacterium]|nr:hypothetical protein [Bacteroidota bacterium]
MKKQIICFALIQLFLTGAFAQVGINDDGSVSNAKAMLDVKSTTSGFLPPRMTRVQRGAISSPAEGLMVICTDCGVTGGAELTVFLGAKWYSMNKQPQWSCGMPIIVTHTAGNVAPVDKQVSYGTVTGIPGEPDKCWITRNLGASQQAASVDDTTEAAAGWYWQFNRKQGYMNNGTTLTPSWTITGINEDLSWQAANDPCAIMLGSGWHVPTYNEWYHVDNSGGWGNWNGPWNSGLKLHAAGVLDYNNGSLGYHWAGFYWSSAQNGTTGGWYLNFYNAVSNVFYHLKANGCSIRCLR